MHTPSLVTCSFTLCAQGPSHKKQGNTALASKWCASHAYTKALERSPIDWPPSQLPISPSSYLVNLFTHMLVVTALPSDKNFQMVNTGQRVLEGNIAVGRLWRHKHHHLLSILKKYVSGVCDDCESCYETHPSAWPHCCQHNSLCCSELARACQTCKVVALQPFCNKHFKRCFWIFAWWCTYLKKTNMCKQVI